MIPYFTLTQVHLGPITIQVWGTMVALGILLGTWASARYAGRHGLDKQVIERGAFWIIVAAFIGARLFHVLAYEPGYYWQDPWEILRIWHGGFSVFGGFLGALVGYALFVKRTGIDWRAYADAFIYGLPLGMGCGRIGCFLIHDHPGTLTHFVLGIRYPDGTVRHDHGLYLSINGFVLALLFYILDKKKRGLGFFCRLYLIWDGTVRFFLDFYRINDTRYRGLTPAQYGSALMVLVGLGWLFLIRRRPRLTKPLEV